MNETAQEVGTIGIVDYVLRFSTRGECQCGRCIDVGASPDPAHSVSVEFFRVGKVGEPTAEEFVRLTKAHEGAFAKVDPFDGREHGYIELGGWIGDQGVALQYMALGSILGVFQLLTPSAVFGDAIPEALRMQMAGSGMVTVRAKEKT